MWKTTNVETWCIVVSTVLVIHVVVVVLPRHQMLIFHVEMLSILSTNVC